MRGQDVATLIVLPLLIVAVHRMRRGSPRATVVWIGLLGYLLYTYAGAAFAYHFDRLFVVYVAVFALSAIAAWTALSGIHPVWFLRARAASLIAPSARLDAWLPDAPFRDTIVVESPAPAPRLMQALEDEIVVGTVGKLHQIRDQEFAEVPTTADFASFAQPNHERLAMSIRAIPGDHGTLLALEHRTQPTDADARRRFARYWLAIRPGGAFVTRQLLNAVARRAERGAGTTDSATHLSN